jgi:antitoxin (DNA-binding transcriptional repressor) of toxin-antitoxin stability system
VYVTKSLLCLRHTRRSLTDPRASTCSLAGAAAFHHRGAWQVSDMPEQYEVSAYPGRSTSEFGIILLTRRKGATVSDNAAKLHITEEELARDTHAVLAKVQEGVEVIVEQDNRPVAVIRLPHRSGRSISEIVRQARERNLTITLDPDFGKDLESIIASHQQSWNPPSWE